MHSLLDKYSKYVNFLVVYIAEAHAINEWPLGDFCVVNQPKTIEERITIAKQFVQDYEFRLPLVVDTMSNEFDLSYSVWPDRFFIVKENKFSLIGKPSDRGYNRNQIEDWINLNYENK